METKPSKARIAIIGGGPSGLFMFKSLVDSGHTNLSVFIFESGSRLGAGMPYSKEGANEEHVTNVSDNEIPELVCTVREWLPQAPPELLRQYGIMPASFNEYKVLPRLLFGYYLEAQFNMLIEIARSLGIEVTVELNSRVRDIKDFPEKNEIEVNLDNRSFYRFEKLVICTGHVWKKKEEGKIAGYFNSPYPPSKLKLSVNFPVAIRGSSLTAVDTVKTLAHENGCFKESEDGKLIYELNDGSSGFRMVLHSINGLLPAIRFHLDDPHLMKSSVLSEEEIAEIRNQHDGFVPLDLIFDRNFKQPLAEKDPGFFDRIKDMKLEEFVEEMMALRERLDPFILFKAEYAEADKSIKRQQPVYWKEMLAVLSFDMNYPAKHFSAEDMMRLKKTLMPLISIVIAFVPQSSCRELIALHDAGVLHIVSVDRSSEVKPLNEGGINYVYVDEDGVKQKKKYKLFIDSIGQQPMEMEDFPFASLREQKIISKAKLRFRDAGKAKDEIENKNELVEKVDEENYYLKVPGIAINDDFQVLNEWGVFNDRIFLMAVPYIAGFNPDYSGLDFGEAASEKISKRIMADIHAGL